MLSVTFKPFYCTYMLQLLILFGYYNAVVFCRPAKVNMLNIQFDPDVVVTDDLANENSPTGPLATLNYLRKFGYLEERNGNSSEGLYSEETISNAVREMQKFGDLPQTGYMDNATIQLLTKPRCGVPDIIGSKQSRPNRFVIGSKGWNKRLLTYRIDNWSPKMYYENVINDMAKAFKVWSEYTRLRFSNKSSSNTDISISFGRGHHNDRYPFDGPGGVLAHAYYPYDHGNLGGDIHFDDDENWVSGVDLTNSGTFNPISFLSVATHELGHSLGLSHSHVRDSVMFPYYQSTNKEPQLHYDDIMAVYQLYIQRELKPSEDEYDGNGGSDEDTENIPDNKPIPTTTTRRTPTTRSYSTTSKYDKHRTTTKKYFYIPRITTTEANTGPRRPDVEEEPPELCKISFDTISFIRNEIFVFKGEYLWRIPDRNMPYQSLPFKMSRLFPCLDGVNKIDASYEREDGKIVFFSGKLYWIFDGTTPTAASAKPITDFGLPKSLKKLDGAFIWEKNHKTYFFSEDKYWRYNERSQTIDDSYPQSISKWTGVPNNIKAVMRWKDGKSYFFKENNFWSFDDNSVEVDDTSPKKSSEYWLGCPKF